MTLNPLYNFDHDCTYPKNVNLGRIRVVITDQHCKNLKRLSRNARRTFTYDRNLKRVVIENERKKGEVVETAQVEVIDPKFSSSELFPEVPNIKPIYDVAMLFSFLSGRRVFTDYDAEDCRNTRYLDAPIEKHLLLREGSIWDRLSEINNRKLSNAVHCIVMSYSSCDLVGMSMYTCAALEICVNSAGKQPGTRKYIAANSIKEVRDKVIDLFRNSLHYRISKRLIAMLKKKGTTSTDIIEDISARINPALSPSALFKLRELLSLIDLVSKVPTEEEENRIKLLNKLRNSIAHSGDIPHIPRMSFDERTRISGSVVLIMQEIVQLYIAYNILGIDSSALLKHSRNNIHEFFSQGVFRGQRVFEEDYEQFILRQDIQWVQEGTI